MYTTEPLNGTHLPNKTLCLTYDDGPGKDTLAIAQFLFEQGIKATFFVVGKYAVEHLSTLSALQAMGHLIGNHTYEHPDLPYYVSVNGDAQNQILRTDAVIKSYINPGTPIFFRTPYGKWSPEVANELNSNLLCTMNHIGPVHWDIAGIDCYYWQQGKSIDEAAENYLTTVREVGKGIIVMHDDTADMDIVKPLNKTLELTKKIVAVLLSEGYRFIGLDEVYNSPASLSASYSIRLQTSNGNYICLLANETFALSASAKDVNTQFAITDCGEGKVTLQSANACYLSLMGETEIEAAEKEMTSLSTFHLIPVFDNRLMLRTYNGNFLTVDKKTGKLTAGAKYMRLATVFYYQPVHKQVSKPVSLQMHYRLWTKRLAFIKSKLLGS